MEPGDVVCLVSGGPPMTVDHLDDNGIVHCVWFESAGKDFDEWGVITDYQFHQPSLRKLSDDELKRMVESA